VLHCIAHRIAGQAIREPGSGYIHKPVERESGNASQQSKMRERDREEREREEREEE